MNPLVPDFAAAAIAGNLAIIAKLSARFHRISSMPESEPWWDKASHGRFDDPLADFGVTYAAETLEVAFAETVIREAAFFSAGTWCVPSSHIEQRCVVNYSHPRSVNLLDLTGAHLKCLGLNNDICSSSEYAFTQALSRAVHDQLPDVDGIYYVSRQLNTRCAAVFFERSGMRCSAVRVKLDQHAHYQQILRMFNVEIID